MPTSTRWLGRTAVGALIILFVSACGGGDSTGGEQNSTGAEVTGLPGCLDFADLYALAGPESDGFATWSDASTLAAALGSSTELPDAPLTVVGPGEESGTYDTFVELVLGDPADTRGVVAAARADYLSSPNDNVIIENVSGADGSLGWVGFAFYIENTDVLRAFELSDEAEGVDCTAPTPQTIASGDYPLSRELYLYVNDARAAESGTLQAYVDRYLGDLYDCATQAGYVALTGEALADSVARWEATGFSGGSDDGSSLDISGSSTVEPISQCVLQQSGFSGSVEGPGTGDGFKRFCAGDTDITDASRTIKDSEAETCVANGVEFTELVVAIDGIAVMTAA